MDLLDLMKSGFSVLEYENIPVEQEKVDKIIKAALAAPTACNNQPQRIKIIADDEGRRKLNNVIPSRYYVPLAFIVCYDKSKSWIRRMDNKNSGEIDASIAATHMMLEATELGLGSLWAMYWDPEKMKKEFELEADIEPVALILAGYKSKEAKPRKGHYESLSESDILI